MRPVSPVVKGVEEVTFAKHQPEYLPLPAIVCTDGTVISRWRLSLRERLRVLFRGSIYLHQLTFGKKLQPQLLCVEKPQLIMMPRVAQEGATEYVN